jgi:DNA polymerase III delta prime subunit
MQNKRQIILVIILIGLLTAAGSFLTNVVSVGIVIPLWLAGSLLVVVMGFGIALAVWQFLLQRDNETVTASQQDRQRLLAKVHSFWIKGVLEKSLYSVVHIELGLHEQPDAIANPWHLVLQQQDQPAHPLPSSTHIIQVYDDALGELLILGEPGSGKTTLLLELTRDLLRHAEADENHPMPIVFNLSSWAVKRQPLTDWLVEEMNIKYQVPRKLGRSWVESNQVLPLLDGLDEVNSDHREACVDAINTYRLQHGLVPMVVCSRSADYLELKKRMLLLTAVVVQPLTTKQIDDYLSAADGQLEAVRVALRDDSVLQELATTPLILSVLALAYHGMSVKDLLAAGSSETRRRQLFEDYVNAMLKRRGTEIHYTPQQTVHWLTWLAKQMTDHSQTEFYIERIQYDWLLDTRSRFVYRIATVLIGMLPVGLLLGLFFGAIFGLVYGLLMGLLAGLFVGLFLGLLNALFDGLGTKRLNWLGEDIEPTEVIAWSQQSVRRGLVVGLIVGLLSGLFVGLLSGAVAGLFVGLYAGLFSALLLGLSDKRMDKHNLVTPNQGVWLSMRNGLRIGLIFGLILGLISRLLLGLISGAVTGLFCVWYFGGFAFIDHFVLRWFLRLAGFMPWHYPRFLDYAAERILLRKVGGGYIFIHRLLLEYFASLDTTP